MKCVQYLIGLGITLGFLIIMGLLLTLFYYFDFVSLSFVHWFKIVLTILGIFGGSFYIGRRSEEKGFLEGMKFGAIYLLLMLIIQLFCNRFSFSLTEGLFLLISFLPAVLGGMIGINFKEKKNT